MKIPTDLRGLFKSIKQTTQHLGINTPISSYSPSRVSRSPSAAGSYLLILIFLNLRPLYSFLSYFKGVQHRSQKSRLVSKHFCACSQCSHSARAHKDQCSWPASPSIRYVRQGLFSSAHASRFTGLYHSKLCDSVSMARK